MSSHRSDGRSHRRHRRHSSARDAPRPPSPAEILEDTQRMLRGLQAQSQTYTEQYNYHVGEIRRLQIMMQSATDERALLSGSAAAAQANRQGRMVRPDEMLSRREQLDNEIENLEWSIQHYQDASASMQRLWQSVETEIQRLQEEIVPPRGMLFQSIIITFSFIWHSCLRMRDLIIEAKAQEALQPFISSIDQSEILDLASSHHNNDPCRMFRPVKHGSFNICFFVQFATPSSDGVPDRWVVRVPIAQQIPWIDEKLDVEIATMKYVTANTTIPVPKIRAHSSAENSPIKMAFIIMDYVEGKNLRELGFVKDLDVWCSVTTQPTRAREKMYEKLAQVFIQLRQLEFPEIGALGLPKGDDDQDIRVRHRPLCIEVLLQQGEGLAPTSRFPERATFKTSKEYVDALLWLGDNLLDKGKNSMIDVRGERVLYAAHHFKRFVMDSWLDPALDRGPFVLVHGDLGIQNLLWDDDLNLVAVLDWEWSSVMPVQFLVPPPWLNGQSIDFLCHAQMLYNSQVGIFCDIVRAQERSLGLGQQTTPLLSDEWTRLKDWCHTLVVCALLRPEYAFDVYWSFINYSLVGFQRPLRPDRLSKYKEITSRQLALFMENDDRRALLSRKEKEQQEYLKEEEDYFGALSDS